MAIRVGDWFSYGKHAGTLHIGTGLIDHAHFVFTRMVGMLKDAAYLLNMGIVAESAKLGACTRQPVSAALLVANGSGLSRANCPKSAGDLLEVPRGSGGATQSCNGDGRGTLH